MLAAVLQRGDWSSLKEDHIRLQSNQLGRHSGASIGIAGTPAIVDPNVVILVPS